MPLPVILLLVPWVTLGPLGLKAYYDNDSKAHLMDRRSRRRKLDKLLTHRAQTARQGEVAVLQDDKAETLVVDHSTAPPEETVQTVQTRFLDRRRSLPAQLPGRMTLPVERTPEAPPQASSVAQQSVEVFSSARSLSLPNSMLADYPRHSASQNTGATASTRQHPSTYLSSGAMPSFSPSLTPRPDEIKMDPPLKPIPTRQIPKHQKECSLLEGAAHDWQHPMVEEYYTVRLNQKLSRQWNQQPSARPHAQDKAFFDQSETAARVAIWGSDATTCSWGWVEKAGHARGTRVH
mmetsp:Transcript_23927/g.52262  ORF Transcript_23927/g.52262 Transcript_23927/m.52262 type:complete len:292 (+) Transcript_23927:332-1207(+)|eukprot:CAMPEP_0118938102 /NCGR_PEP_ID=MMETSP1169-20130426/24764_1 /TAXON_ID=36882 /ORGANISM="Pyramimonas obovata, Strain CCMP722" /LENGTH=291 /DNA_ID=CAMNT_0006881939 /DNA_START=328 /DNA_END=1203 /DNA_ORIENTATION=-